MNLRLQDKFGESDNLSLVKLKYLSEPYGP